MVLTSETLCQLNQVDVVRAGRRVLHAVSLSIAQGDTVAVVGPNGSGKTTLLRALHGLPGTVAGQRWGLPAAQVGMVFQRPCLFRFSPLSHVRLAAWLQGSSWSQAGTSAQRALAQVGLQHTQGQNALHLSGGQQQRLALACAWVRQPRLLLLDEPTANLDPGASREVEQLLADWSQAARQGAKGQAQAIVFSSHQMAQVRRLAKRVVYVQEGRVMADLPVHDFFDPATLAAVSPQAALFLNQETL